MFPNVPIQSVSVPEEVLPMPRKPPFPSVSKAKSRAKELEAMKAVLARADL